MIKEKLLAWGGGTKEYTHIITIDYNPDNISQIGFFENVAGSLVPTIFKDTNNVCNILELLVVDNVVSARSSTTVLFNTSVTTQSMYLGRADTQDLLGSGGLFNIGHSAITWQRRTLFRIEEVGKQIPIWLATTPPHGVIQFQTILDILAASSVNKASNNATFYIKEVA